MNLDPEKVLVLFVIALLVLGPERLPKAARALGKGLAELRKYTSSFQSEVNQVLAEPRAVVQSALQEMDMRSELDQFRNQVQALGQGTDGSVGDEAVGVNGTPIDEAPDHDWAHDDWAPADPGLGTGLDTGLGTGLDDGSELHGGAGTGAGPTRTDGAVFDDGGASGTSLPEGAPRVAPARPAPGQAGALGGLSGSGLMPAAAPDDPGLN